MRAFFFLLSCLLFSFSLSAQSVLVFEPAQARFNNGEPLPAEEAFAIRGPLTANASRVEFQIFHNRDKEKEKPFYENNWQESALTGNPNAFYIPINQKLRGNRKYDIQITYFAPVSMAHNDELQTSLVNYLYTYIQEHSVMSPEQVKLRKKPEKMFRELNGILKNSLREYRIVEEPVQAGFSDLVRLKLESLHQNRLTQADKLFGSGDEPMEKIDYYNQQLMELQELIAFEVQNLLQNNLLKVTEKFFIDDYASEETPTILTLHAGYGGIFIDGPLENLDYVSGPYAGISFPLGNKAFASKFWYNSSLVAGVFINNMEADNGQVVSGPIIKRPIYAGLSYKIFEFVRFSAGATLLENEATAGNLENLGSSVYIRPFIGLQADFNLWLDLAR